MFLIVIMGLVLVAPKIKANETINNTQNIILKDSTAQIELNNNMEIMRDRNLQYTINDVATREASQLFVPIDEVEKKIGFFETRNWFHFTIENQSNERDWFLELAFPLVYEIKLYGKENGEIKLLYEGGVVTHPFSHKEIRHRNFVFDIDVLQGTSREFYLMAAGPGDLIPPILIWDKNKFVEKTEIEFILLGLYYGIILVMIIYNLFIFASLRIKSYLYYVFVILFVLLGALSINGIGFQYLWPNSPTWNYFATPFFVTLSTMFVLIFSKHFLNLSKHIHSFNYFYYPLVVLNLIVVLSLFFSQYFALTLMVFVSFASFITVLLSAMIALIRGVREARFYLIGWVIFLTGVSLTILERVSILPYSLFVEYAGQAGLSIEVVFLSLALADKINIMRREKDAAEKRAQESQRQAIENLHRADQLKDEFLAITSHELRTPLYGIIGIAETIRDGIAGEVSNDMKKQLSMIIHSGKRLTFLVDEILDLSKLKYDSLTLDLKKVDLNNIIEIVLAISKTQIVNKPVEIVKNIPQSLPYVIADENRIQQILHNLIDNAIKYTDEGKIIISVYETDSEVAIQVTDTGRGISKEEIKHIFEPFQQGESSELRHFDGVGIGLNVAKNLIDLHNGTIDVTSTIGIGSIFTVTLPVYDEAELKDEVAVTMSRSFDENMGNRFEKTQLQQFNSKRNKKNATILVVDDEIVNLQVLMNQLTLNDYDVLTATSGLDVLTIVEENEIDLIILDIMMPGMSGYDVCRKLRETYSLMELPVLMLTAKNQLRDKMLSFKAGANDYLVKPCNRQELLARVKTLVQAKQLNEELIQLNLHLEDKVLERTSELKIANENLRTMADQRRQLLANIAHELGTPLTLIHNYIQSLQQGLIQINDEHYMKLVNDKINLLNRLIDDLFDLSRLESKEMSLNLKQFRIDEWTAQLLKKCHFATEQGNRTFSSNTVPIELKNFIGHFDEERMDQLFSNLISNAINNTKEENGEISIDVKIIENCELMIAVSDNGYGIHQEDLPYIFERFYRKKTSNYDQFGTGLGLAIVKRIVDNHKGNITVNSILGYGTTFYVTLPIEDQLSSSSKHLSSF